MSGELKYITFNADMGWVGILASAKGLLGTTLPCVLSNNANESAKSSQNLSQVHQIV